MKKVHQMIIFLFLLICILIGGVLAIWLIGQNSGHYDWKLVYPMITGILIGSIIVFLFSLLWKKKRRNIPPIDERTVLLLKRYFLVMLYVIMIGSSVILIILYGLGIHTIETGLIIIYMIGLYLLIGIGAFITKQL